MNADGVSVTMPPLQLSDVFSQQHSPWLQVSRRIRPPSSKRGNRSAARQARDDDYVNNQFASLRIEQDDDHSEPKQQRPSPVQQMESPVNGDNLSKAEDSAPDLVSTSPIDAEVAP
jgi:hypothetical protein